jgi:hypothetical protein
VDRSNFLPAGEHRSLESVVGNSGGFGLGDDFEGLENPWVDLVLDSRVLSLKVISDDAEVDVFVSGLDVRQVSRMDIFKFRPKVYVRYKGLGT